MALIFAVCLAVRLPERTDYLVNWDSVQFAMATDGFDLHHHRPHPPGYIGYVTSARVLNVVTGDANLSLVVLSMLAGAAAPALFFPLASEMLSRRRAIIATVLFASSPLLWYYSGVALTYAPETALAVAFGLLAWRARHRGGAYLIAASILLSIIGATRQTGAVLLAPLWLWSIWPWPNRDRLRALAALAAVSLLWLVPLLWLSGGPWAYIRESRALAELAGQPSTVFRGNAISIGRNWFLVTVSLIATAGAAPLPLIRGRSLGRRAIARIQGSERAFLLAWILPGLATFLLLHMGQAGYMLIITPAVVLALTRLWPSDWLASRSRAVSACALAVAANAMVVLWLPGAVYDNVSPNTPFAGHIRQYAPAQSDEHWRQIINFAESYEPGSVAILAALGGPRSSGSFRHLSYYLPAQHIYAAGFGSTGTYGHLYSAFGGKDDYQIADMPRARRVLALPAGVTTLVIPDRQVASLVSGDILLIELELPGRNSIWIAPVAPGSMLLFESGASGDPAIGLLPGEMGDGLGMVEATGTLLPDGPERAGPPLTFVARRLANAPGFAAP